MLIAFIILMKSVEGEENTPEGFIERFINLTVLCNVVVSWSNHDISHSYMICN